MDIYKYAESVNWNADYYEMKTGYTYGIQEAGRARKFFGVEAPIKIYNSEGQYIGDVIQVDEKEIDKIRDELF